MKKLLSLFLALIMALGLCTTAFAGNAAGTTALYLTGSAADQVVNLKSGQLVDSSSDVAVRLNVQEDPGETEYTVTLDGQEIEADHSTAQYHFYYLPASRLAASAATLSIDDGTSSNEPAITVTINGVTRTVALPADGSTDFAKPTALTAEYTYAESSGALDRIYLGISDETAVNIGTSLSSKTGVLSGTFAKLTAGYTTSTFYFYKTPKKLTKTVYVVYTDAENAAHYYKITISRAPQDGCALGPNMNGYSEETPGGLSTYDTATGCINGMAKFVSGSYSMIYTAMDLYTDGTKTTVNAEPDWTALEEENGKLYYLNGTNAYFARPGRYWLPVSYTTESGEVLTDVLPIDARCQFVTTASDYVTKAEVVKGADYYDAIPEATRNQFETAIDKVNLMISENTFSKSVYLTADGEYTMNSEESSGVTARYFCGGLLYGEGLVESDLNTILDLTAIFTTWGTDAELAAWQYEAYQKISAINKNAAIDIQSLEDRDTYQTVHQAKWDLIHTTDLEGINAILTDLELETIAAEPQVTPGDINGDGEINILDASALVQHINEIVLLDAEKLEAADINGDGTVDIMDASKLVQYINEIISSLN